MTGSMASRVPGRGVTRAVRGFFTGLSAVGVKELRGRMRGRRAFVVVTVFLALLSAFAFGIHAYLRQQATLQAASFFRDVPLGGMADVTLSADIGHAIFAGLLLVLTLLVMVLAPALTTGAISLEREKQTIDLLVTTPLSTLGMVVGKLLSALGYVFLLILASVPLMAIVFVFGGVGPDDLVRAYGVLLATAFGMGAIGLFISAITRRTQTATVIALIVVLGLTLGTASVHEFWRVLSTETARTQSGFIPVSRSDRAPEALLWLNPFVADLDLICTTAPGGYDRDTCGYVAAVTGTPFFATSSRSSECPDGGFCADPAVGADGPDLIKVRELDMRNMAFADGGVAMPLPDAPPEPADDVFDQPVSPTLGFPRDTFWPQTVIAYLAVGVVLTLVSAQLVAPTRRARFLRGRSGPGVDTALWGTAPAGTASEVRPTAAATRDGHADPSSPDEVTS